MLTVEPVSSSTIPVFTRHSAECPRADEPRWKRCNCRKSLYIREGGKTTYVSAKTRSWDETERFAQRERDRRDPVRVQLQKIADAEMAKAESSAAKLVPLREAFEQWLTGMKKPGDTSVNAYRSTTRRILRWAEREGLVYVSDVTSSRCVLSPGPGIGFSNLPPLARRSPVVPIVSLFFESWRPRCAWEHRGIQIQCGIGGQRGFRL